MDFHASSGDVTYGFGVFRQDNSMVFQMQVVPGQDNHIIWKFDDTGWYDVRSTEYSGPSHSDMVPAGCHPGEVRGEDQHEKSWLDRKMDACALRSLPCSSWHFQASRAC